MKGMGRYSVILVLAGWASVAVTEPNRNILWDGGFEIGFGNTFWGVPYGNAGPNPRSMWTEGAVRLLRPMASRLYWLNDGTYALCAWVKVAPGETKESTFRLKLTNNNYYKIKRNNEYSRQFTISPGDQWQRVGWSLEIRSPFRPYFHVEVSGDNLLVDAVSLTHGAELPERVLPASDVEAGFFIPEETLIYVEGEDRHVELVVRNHAEKRRANVAWEIYDHREELVRKGSVDEKIPSSTTVRKRLPVQDLPYGGYRLASSVKGETVLGDALVAFLPRIRQDEFMEYGGDAAIGYHEFMGRFMKRLGMKLISTLSPGGCVGRWRHVEPVEGQYVWQDQAVDAARKEGLEVIGLLGLKYPPPWLKASLFDNEEAFTKAYCRYVDAFVRHYAGRISIIIFEDEVHGMFNTPERLAVLGRLFKAAYETAKRAARESNTRISVGINGSYTSWWEKAMDTVGPAYIDFVSQNTVLNPARAAQTLNMLRKKHCYPEYFYTLGVGGKSMLRKTSLLMDRISFGSPGGQFAWWMMTHAWLSRPYGTDDPQDGPIVRFGYYDLRVLGRCIFNPVVAKCGIEYDNSPTLGLQAMAMQKYFTSGMRPARHPRDEFTLKGIPTQHETLCAYPFRNDRRATVILTTHDGSNLGSRWTLSDMDFRRYPLVDIYGQALPLEKDAAVARGLPVFLRDIPARDLDAAQAAVRGLKASVVEDTGKQRLELGKYVVEIDPGQAEGLTLITRLEGKERVILDRLLIDPPPIGRPTLATMQRRLDAKANLGFANHCSLGINMEEQGIKLDWTQTNNEKKSLHYKVRVRLSPSVEGHEISIEEGNTKTVGALQKDLSILAPVASTIPASLISSPSNFSRITIKNVAAFELPPATGKGYAPEHGFRWKVEEGEAFLEADYTLKPYAGGGTAGVQGISLGILITAP